MTEYRVCIKNGRIYDWEKLYLLYQKVYSVMTIEEITKVWNTFLPLDISEDTDMEDLQEKMYFIYKPEYSWNIPPLFIHDPTSLLKLVQKNPCHDNS